MPIAIYALALAAFAIGTTEFIVSGILPEVSADLAVSIPTAGLLVTGYAAGVAVGGPILALLTARVPYKPMILILMLIFALGQVLCAFAPDYGMLLAARLVSACGHGVFFGIAALAVARLVPQEKRGAALALFIGGITIANILGLPGGTAIGQAFGWRMTFAAIAVLALLATAAIAYTLPPGKPGDAPAASLRVQGTQLRHPQVFSSYLIIVLVMIGSVSFSTYQVPLLIDITGVPPQDIPYYLLLAGAGAVAGIYLGGRLTDWNLAPSLVGVLCAQVVSNAALLLSVHSPVAMAINLFLGSCAGFAFSTPIQVRILNAARAAPNLAATLISAAYNIGIAGGALLGAMLLSAGLSYALLALVGVVASGLAALAAILTSRTEAPAPLAA